MTTTIRLPDPLSSPGAPGFVSARILDNNPVFRERLPGGRVITLESSSQYWGVQISYEELFPEQFEIVTNCILESKSTGNPITLMLPQKEFYRVSGNMASTTIAAGQQGSTISIGKWDGLIAIGTPKIGDLFKLTNHSSKVYMITKVSLFNNVLTLGIYPNLMKPTVGTEKPIFNNILFQLALESPEKWESNFTAEGIYAPFTIELGEHITYD